MPSVQHTRMSPGFNRAGGDGCVHARLSPNAPTICTHSGFCKYEEEAAPYPAHGVLCQPAERGSYKRCEDRSAQGTSEPRGGTTETTPLLNPPNPCSARSRKGRSCRAKSRSLRARAVGVNCKWATSVIFPNGYVASIPEPMPMESDEGTAVRDPGTGAKAGASPWTPRMTSSAPSAWPPAS
jgi:hypothetical protein